MKPCDLTFVDEAVQRIGCDPDAVIPILQAVQDHYGYLPSEALRRVCATTAITPAAIQGVATFYDSFRHKAVGQHMIRVCRGTACHVTGAERVEDSLRRHLKIPAADDTDPTGQYTIEQVACLGCCTLAPVVKIDETTFGHTAAEKVAGLIHNFERYGKTKDGNLSTEELLPDKNHAAQINIGLGSCCMAKGSDRLFRALQQGVEGFGADVRVKRVGCVGMCHHTPLIEVVTPGKQSSFYAGLEPEEAKTLVARHFRPRGLLRRTSRLWARAMDALLIDE